MSRFDSPFEHASPSALPGVLERIALRSMQRSVRSVALNTDSACSKSISY